MNPMSDNDRRIISEVAAEIEQEIGRFERWYVCTECGKQQATQPDYVCGVCFYSDQVAYEKASGNLASH